MKFIVVLLALLFVSCDGESPTQVQPPVINVTVNNFQDSQNAGQAPGGQVTPSPTCGTRRTSDVGWSVMGGFTRSGTPIDRFATTAPNGSIVQFDITPKDATGNLPAECHGSISYSTPSGPCRAVSVQPDNFNPRVEITGSSGVCALTGRVDGLSVTVEIQAVS